ncbi:MAG: LruC domain-containing protein [Bacteroidota bacterium]|nr:LruC domain-containing protein [Bacteroidota bacterium]
MKTKALFMFWMIAMLGLLVSNCNKNKLPDGEIDMRQMNVPAQFNFEAVTALNITVKLPTSVDYSERNKRVEILDAGPGQNGQVLNAGAADHEGILRTTVLVPVQTDTLFIRSFAGWKILPLDPGMKSMTDEYESNYNDTYGNNPPDTIMGGEPLMKPGGLLDKGLLDKGLLKSGANWLTNGDFESDDFLKKSFWFSETEVTEQWYVTRTIDTYTSIIDTGSSKVVQIQNTRNVYGGICQIIDVEEGEEVSFSAEVRALSGSHYAWLYFAPRRNNGGLIKFYNVQVKNPGSGWNTMTLTATMPADATTLTAFIWTNDWGTGQIQFDNAVLTVKGRVSDSDGDGVEDDEDAYPNDANKAFNNYYPSEKEFGTLAFEDMWPNEGDYDFNDLVLGYRYNHVKNAKNEITSMIINYKLRAIGASIHNGFGFQMDITPDKIKQVTSDYQFTDDDIYIAGNGTENKQDLATIIVFDDAFKLLTHSGEGLGINTDLKQKYVEPIDINLQIDFTSGLSIKNLGNAPNNPFLFRTNDRGWEIHLPGYEPTDLADQNRFGTGDDATNPDYDYYYKTARGLPWGMNLPVSFVYTVEKVPINQGHLKFQQWATSGGYSFMDWYEDREGYRDNSKLYIR